MKSTTTRVHVSNEISIRKQTHFFLTIDTYILVLTFMCNWKSALQSQEHQYQQDSSHGGHFLQLLLYTTLSCWISNTSTKAMVHLFQSRIHVCTSLVIVLPVYIWSVWRYPSILFVQSHLCRWNRGTALTLISDLVNIDASIDWLCENQILIPSHDGMFCSMGISRERELLVYQPFSMMPSIIIEILSLNLKCVSYQAIEWVSLPREASNTVVPVLTSDFAFQNRQEGHGHAHIT